MPDKITKEDFQNAFNEQLADALMGGSPEGMGERIEALHGIDMDILNEVYEEQFERAVDFLAANKTMEERLVGKSSDEVHAEIARSLASLMALRFFFAGFSIAKERANATL